MCQICMKFGAGDTLSHYTSFLSLGKQPNQACSIKTPHPNDWKWRFFYKHRPVPNNSHQNPFAQCPFSWQRYLLVLDNGALFLLCFERGVYKLNLMSSYIPNPNPSSATINQAGGERITKWKCMKFFPQMLILLYFPLSAPSIDRYPKLPPSLKQKAWDEYFGHCKLDECS